MPVPVSVVIVAPEGLEIVTVQCVGVVSGSTFAGPALHVPNVNVVVVGERAIGTLCGVCDTRAKRGSWWTANSSMTRPMPVYRLIDRAGNDLGFLEHPVANLGPCDVIWLLDGQEARVTTRIDGDPGLACSSPSRGVSSPSSRARGSRSSDPAIRVLF